MKLLTLIDSLNVKNRLKKEPNIINKCYDEINNIFEQNIYFYVDLLFRWLYHDLRLAHNVYHFEGLDHRLPQT